jgi:hypothetical protein
MPRLPRLAPVLLCFAAWSCDLGRADVVSRSPGLGPPTTTVTPDGAADASDGGSIADADARDLTEDGRSNDHGGSDAGAALDGRDGSAQLRNDAPGSTDATCQGETAGACGPSGLVMTDDFEDGAAGWMSTGAIWTVTADSTSAQANSVLSPTGAAASSVYYSHGAWQDMTAQVRLRVTSFGQASSANRAELYARYQDAGHFYGLGLCSDQHLVLRRNAGSLGAAATVAVAEGEWHVLKLKVSGPANAVSVEGYLDGVLMVTATDLDGSLPSPWGTVGVGIYGQTLAHFDDVSVSSP